MMNTFFQHKRSHNHNWYRDFVGQRSLIDFCIVSADLFSVFDDQIERGESCQAYHHQVVRTLKAMKL